jgi:hypothetical protein
MHFREEQRRSGVGLSGKEWLFFGLLFLVIPLACIFVSSILYYSWKNNQPKRANQINALGFIVFGVQLFLLVAYFLVVGPDASWLNRIRFSLKGPEDSASRYTVSEAALPVSFLFPDHAGLQ